jgi:hypothetical protein
MKVFVRNKDGMRTWTFPELCLDKDLDLYETLYKESLDFNFTDFFAKRAAESKAEAEAERLATIR